MTNQIQGETLFEGWEGSATSSTWVYTPWIPVQSDIATFAVEVIAVNSVTLEWDVETRTRASVSANSVITAQSTTTVGITETSNIGSGKELLELVRYKFNTSAAAANTTDFVTFRALSPVWHRDR